MSKNKYLNKFIEFIFFISTLISVISLFSIGIFIFFKGIPAIFEIGIGKFIFGNVWKPSKMIFGIFPMIMGSIYVTLGAIILGVPLSILSSIFIMEYTPKKIRLFLNSLINLLAGIPSVVYGFLGLIVIVPIINKYLGGRGAGNSLLATCIILAIMILPTIISTCNTAIASVSKESKEGSIALGASKEQTIFKVMLRECKSTIFSGIVLGIGRAMGETMAVILISGNTPNIPKFLPNFLVGLTDPIRTLTANIALEMGYASGLHQKLLFSTGVILFIFIIILNLLISFFNRKIN